MKYLLYLIIALVGAYLSYRLFNATPLNWRFMPAFLGGGCTMAVIEGIKLGFKEDGE